MDGDAEVSALRSVRGVEVMIDVGPLGVSGLTVRVPGEPEPGPGQNDVERRRASDPVVEYDDDELVDPGGCEF
jgi:hypothetical protein